MDVNEQNGSNPPLIDGDGTSDSHTEVNDLIRRAMVLLSELQAFRDRIRSLRHEGVVETATFRGTVESELNMLQRLSLKPENESTVHVARSSNLPFLEQVWSVAKMSKHLLALQKRVYLDPDADWQFQALHMHQSKCGRSRKGKKKGYKEEAVIVDAITDGGRTWNKVSLVSNTRLLFDLAKQGWECSDSDDDGADNDELVFGSAKYKDDDFDVPLIKTAKQLSRASNVYRIRTKHPSVRLILPRIERGDSVEIDRILQRCEALGIVTICSGDLRPQVQFESALQTMARDPVMDFSDILNIDCTILLALVSDFSHAEVPKESWFHRGLQRQVEVEGNEKLLPSLLYPVLGNLQLSCTKQAVDRMREIVETIGTPTEKARTNILFRDDALDTQIGLVENLQQLSAYPVPTDIQLPIVIVNQELGNYQSCLPDVAKLVSTEMSLLNRSVFLYGWAEGRTTITSNRNVVKQIQNGLERFEDLDDSVFPSIWLCPTARSLVGKEKRGVSTETKGQKTLKLPDPLHREHMRRNGLDVLSMREGCEVEDLRPNGYPCEDVISAKIAAVHLQNNSD